jgi:hypothetical protein
MGVGIWRACKLATKQCNESVSDAAVLGSTDTQKGEDVSYSCLQWYVLEHYVDSLKVISCVMGEYAEKLFRLVWRICLS